MPGFIITTLPSPSRESKLVWFDGGAVVTVAFPEFEFPLSLVDADDPDPEAVLDAVVFVPDCELEPVADVFVVFPVADEVLAVVVAEFEDAVFELLSCLLFIMMALFSDESGHGQACVRAAKDAMVARNCIGRMLEVIEMRLEGEL